MNQEKINGKLNPLIVKKENFNEQFIKELTTETSLKIIGKYKLTQQDYNNLIVYSNIDYVEVEDIEDFEIGKEIEIKTTKQIEFKTKQFKKIKINKIEKYNKKTLTISLPFEIYFENDCLYSEEEEFKQLIKYIEDIEILNINLKTQNTTNKAIETIYKIENKINKKIQFINFITENRTIKDIEKFKFLEDDRIIKIWYEDGITDCKIDEYITMRKNIDKLVNEIKEKKLTNFEKVIYTYDIVKKYNYNKSDNDYSMDGRQLHKIFNTNNIVCSGYARLISQILNELGIKSGIYKLITKNNELHARNLVHIIDEKYNINSIYSMEPTWESALNEQYSYGLFLTPIEKLKEYFPKEKFREDIDVLCGTKKINEISLKDRISLYQFFQNKDLTQIDIEKTLKETTKKVTLNKFCNALVNVKAAEGISENILKLNVKNIIEYNNNLTEIINKKMETKISFFKEN